MSEYLLTKETVKFGVPEQKKFPLPDADHVRSAIKFFNYVEPKYEKELAKAILAKAEEFGVDLSEMSIGDNNRFSKYLVHSELYHHGILGQKWGVRRFQNKDGSYTSAGKERRRDENSHKNFSVDKETLKKIAKIAAITAAVGVTAYAASRNKAVVTELLKKTGKVAASKLSQSASRVGNAMVDAALLSVGNVAISKLAKKMPVDDSVDESTRIRNQITFDTVSAGIREATKANGSSSSNNNNGGSVGKELTDRLGAPSKKGIDKQSSEYQNLFKDANGNQRDSGTRSVIKSLASAGYDLDQLREYVRGVDNGTIRHSLMDVGYYTVIQLIDSNYI